MEYFALPGCNSSESLLPCYVPGLQLDGLPFKFDGSEFEVHLNGGDVASSLCICRQRIEEGACRGRHSRPRTPSKSTDTDLDCVYVKCLWKYFAFVETLMMKVEILSEKQESQQESQ